MSEQMNRKINKSAQQGIDYKLELLELEHESNLKYLEKNSKDKEALMSKKEELNAKYKAEKEELEKQKSLL
jgi:predicted nuclease with TOPRIM domain